MKKRMMKRFQDLGILDPEIFVSKKFLNEQAVKAGASMSFSVCGGAIDFYLNEAGELVGHATTSAKSWKKYRGPKPIKKFKVI